MRVDRCFLPFEAAKIKSLPVCMTPQEDILIWPKSKEGVYTVKSGYQLLCEMEDRDDIRHKFFLFLQNFHSMWLGGIAIYHLSCLLF